MTPKISVIVPVFNAEEYLGECLDSILLQKMDDLEIICVNNASTDGSLSILQTYAMLDSRVKIVDSEHLENAAVKDVGIQHAQGEFITFLNPTDFYDETMLDQAVSLLENDSSDLLIAGCVVYDNTKGQVVEINQIDQEYLAASPLTSAQVQANFFPLKNITCWVQIWKSAFIRKYDLKFGDATHKFDEIFFLGQGLIFPAQVSLSPVPLVVHRINWEQKAENPFDDIFAATMLTVKKTYERLGDKKNDDATMAAYIYHFQLLMAQTLFLSQRDRKENLLSISQYIPQELFEKLFFCPKPHVKVSMVIHVHGSPDNLVRCLESVVNQTLQEIEIVCVNDTDDVALFDILNKYEAVDKRIKIITKQKCKKENNPYNKGLQFVAGVFVQFLDSNDFLEPDACEVLYLYSQLYNLDMCVYSVAQTEGNVTSPWVSNNVHAVWNLENVQNTLFGLTQNAPAAFYKYTFLKKNKIEWKNPELFSEFPFFMESIIDSERVGDCSCPLYHQNEEQSRENHLSEYSAKQRAVLKLIKKYVSQTAVLEKYMTELSLAVYAKYVAPKGDIDAKTQRALYALYYSLMKNFHCHLPAVILAWCKKYLKTHGLKEQLKFGYYLMLSKMIRDRYSINLISFCKRPFVALSMLGIPVLKIEQAPKTAEMYFLKIKVLCVPILVIQKKRTKEF